METLFDFSLEVTRWLQENYPQIEGFFQFITALGREEFYLLLLPLVYWCFHKPLGKYLGFIFLIGAAINPMMKHALRGPRPFWIDPDIGLSEQAGYGVPSGHMQYTTTLYVFLAIWFRKRWVWAFAIFMALMMGLSRIYLGVHFVHDVVLGLLIALALLAAYAVWRRYFERDFNKRILGQRLMAITAVPTLLVFIYLIIRLIIGEPDMSVDWASHIPASELISLKDFITGIGASLGFAIGILLEARDVRFRTSGPIWQRVARFVLGLIIMIGIWEGLGALAPKDSLWVAIPFRLIRYFLTMFWIAYLAPKLFIFLKLGEADPKPELSLKL